MKADDELNAVAAEHALGLLPASERARVEDRMAHDPALTAAVADWAMQLGSLESRFPTAAPPAGMLEAIESRIAAEGGDLPGTMTLRNRHLTWVTLAEGVTAAVLFKSERLKRQSVLIRMQPGAHYASHEHPEDEECLVIEGDLRFGNLHLEAGDFHLAPKGRPHPPAVSRSGCLLYVSTSI